MEYRIGRAFFFLGSILLFFYACTSEVEPILTDERLTANFRWIPGQETRNREDVTTGIAWALSYLGAELPKNALTKTIIWKNDYQFKLNLNKAGFEREALIAFSRILDEFRSSEEYTYAEGIDIGRFVMLTINSSYHYYRITGIPETLSEFRSLYKFNGKRLQVTHSAIASNDRLLEIADANRYEDIAHIGGETGGSFSDPGEFSPIEFEVFDMMRNGQLRFAIYDKSGRLKPEVDVELTSAGKISKCLWCHEVNVQPLFNSNAVLEDGNSLTQIEFSTLVDEQFSIIDQYRLALDTDVDHSNRLAHEKMEKLYEDFMETSVERLVIEWKIPRNEIQTLLAGIPTHNRNGESGFYDRKDIDHLAPYGVVRVPDFGREKSSYEPNFF